jgi:hypothetical protein
MNMVNQCGRNSTYITEKVKKENIDDFDKTVIPKRIKERSVQKASFVLCNRYD